jgi:hypothetical protein
MTPPLDNSPLRHWRTRLLVAGAALAILVGGFAFVFRPHYSTIEVPSGSSYDIIRVTVDSGIAGLFPSVKQEPALLVNYYARVGDQDEARLHLIVIQQTTPLLFRWLPLVRGQMRAYHLVVGQWEPAH